MFIKDRKDRTVNQNKDQPKNLNKSTRILNQQCNPEVKYKANIKRRTLRVIGRWHKSKDCWAHLCKRKELSQNGLDYVCTCGDINLNIIQDESFNR